RRVLGRRERAGPKGSGKNPRLHSCRSPSACYDGGGFGEVRMSMPQPNTFRGGPDERGHFGMFGGRFVAETLMPLILELEQAYANAKADPAFQAEMNSHLEHYVGRPSPLYFAQRMSEHLGGAKIYFKREDLNHTGAHKVNNVQIGRASCREGVQGVVGGG